MNILEESKLLPEIIYDAILDYDGKEGYVYEHTFFSKDDAPDDAQKLFVYFDTSVKLLFVEKYDVIKCIAKSVCDKLYDEMRYIDYKDLREDGRPRIKCHNWYYTFYDDAAINAEYHREKVNGREIDYMRVKFTFVAKIDKIN